MTRIRPLFILLVLCAAACGGAGDPAADDAGDDGGDDDPTSCEPNELFCAGDEVRQCTASGTDSVREWQCPPLPIEQMCVTCPDTPTGFGCDAAVPAIAGGGVFGAGGTAWSFDYRLPGGCDQAALQTTATTGDGAFHHDAYFGSNRYINFNLRRLTSYDGPLFEARDLQQSTVALTVLAPWPGTGSGTVCFNATTAPVNPPPTQGRVSVRLAGTAPADAFTIEVQGHLLCSVDGELYWVPIAFTTEGVVIQGA